MKYHLILVSRPDAPALKEAKARAQKLGFEHRTNLSPGEALALRANTAPRELAAALDPLAMDWCLHAGEIPQKKLLICDMDSTIIGQECLDELADMAGFGDEVRAITARAMAGELNFEQALRTRVALLAGKPASLLDDCYEQRITLNSGARTLASTMRARGAMTALVSGGFTFFTAKVAAQAGFEAHQANVLLKTGDTLSGKVSEPILGRKAKATALHHYCDAHGLVANDALAIGDGANDLALIEAAGLGIAYRAKPILAKASEAKINHTTLTTALFFQGIKRSEFTD